MPERPTVQLAEFAAGLRLADVPEAVLEQARYVVMDTVAAMAAGARWQSTAGPLAAVTSTFGSGASSLVGRTEGGSIAAAAFFNGAVSHGLNFDTLGAGNAHVGCSAVPGPLAVAEREGLTGAEFLASVVVAAEIVSRLAATASAAGPRPGLMLGQQHGYFATAAGCARAMSLTARDVASALGNALMQAAGTMEVMRLGDEDAKEAYAGFASLGGLVAADLARSGVSNTVTALEGDQGYFPLILGIPAERLAPLVADLGRTYLSGEIHYKRWPLSVNVERYVAALAQLGDALPDVDAIESIDVEYLPVDRPWLEPTAERTAPSTLAGAANSIQYSIASYLVDRGSYLGALDVETLTEPRRIALAAGIGCREADTDSGRALVVRLRDGEELRVPVLGRFPPASEGEHPSIVKLRAVWRSRDDVTADDVVRLVEALDSAPSVEPLCQSLRTIGTEQRVTQPAETVL